MIVIVPKQYAHSTLEENWPVVILERRQKNQGY